MQYSVALSKPKKKLHHRIDHLLSLTDFTVNGNQPWDISIQNDNFYHTVLKKGSVGLGESYLEGWWDVPMVDEFICRVLRADFSYRVHFIQDLIYYLQALTINQQCPSRSYEVGEKHYDISNQLYECMLDKRMIYSCAFWKKAKTLDEAQEDKLDMFCRKLELKPGLRVLDIGCGWGGMAHFAAEN